MAANSGRSSGLSTSMCGGRGVGGRSNSPPIPYREHTMQYGPEMKCSCGNKAPRWISWSLQNPTRRYYTCARSRAQGGCELWEWFDPAITSVVQANADRFAGHG